MGRNWGDWWILDNRKSKPFGRDLERWVDQCVEVLDAVCPLWFFLYSKETRVHTVPGLTMVNSWSNTVYYSE